MGRSTLSIPYVGVLGSMGEASAVDHDHYYHITRETTVWPPGYTGLSRRLD